MATGVGVSVTDFIDGVTGKIRPQFLETIKNRFLKGIDNQTFFWYVRKSSVYEAYG